MMTSSKSMHLQLKKAFVASIKLRSEGKKVDAFSYKSQLQIKINSLQKITLTSQCHKDQVYNSQDQFRFYTQEPAHC